MATENVSRKSLINAFCTIVLTNEDNAATIAASMDATPEAVKNAASQVRSSTTSGLQRLRGKEDGQDA